MFVKQRHKIVSLIAPKLYREWSLFYKLQADLHAPYWVAEVPRPSTLFVAKLFGNHPLVCAEIGVAFGYNAESILSELPVKKMYLIDPYEDYVIHYCGEIYHADVAEQEERLKMAKQRLKQFSDKCVWIRERSAKAAPLLKESLDFVYIDGEKENAEDIKRDLELYFSLLSPSGVLAGHDLAGDCVPMAQAVVSFAKEHKLLLHGKRVDWWFQKNVTET